MLDNIKEQLNELKTDSEDFKDFIKKDKEAYLCSCFLIEGSTWQLDFYSKKTKAITSFTNNNLVYKESKIFTKHPKDLEELDLEKIKIHLDEALEKVNKKYEKEPFEKSIIVLQQEKRTPIWNITIITKTLNVINAKVNAVSGIILADKIEPVLSFKAS